MSAAFFLLKTSKFTRGEDGKDYRFIRPLLLPREQIFATFKARMTSDLASAGDGIYTWIIKDDGKMYLSKTLGNQEIGSLHGNLDMFSGDPNVIAAGELNKEGTTVTYNLRSGTYMENVITTREVRNEKVKLVSDLISTNGLTPKFLKCKGDENGNGTEECTEEYETMAGMNIIDKLTNIVTPMSEIELYKTMFTLEGTSEAASETSAAGGSSAPSSSKGGKRKSRSKLKAKAKKHRSLRKRPRLT